MDEQQGKTQSTDDQLRDHDATRNTQDQNLAPEEELTCVACGHPIEQDDLECPNCGISLVAG